MKQEINTTKEVSNEPLYFEMKDNFSSFFISDSDILKCVLVADSNKKIPTLTDDWIRQAKDYILKNDDIVVLEDFGKALGTTDVEGQLNHIELYKNILNSQLIKSKEEYKEKSKLYKVLGFFTGSIIAIMFI